MRQFNCSENTSINQNGVLKMLIKIEVLKKMSGQWEAELDAMGTNAHPDAYLLHFFKAPPISPSRAALEEFILNKMKEMSA
ncbi:MAG: hypothetical protein CTY10_01230 [Methylotenera sp.]|nr:MAG: hypothetical protein CTY10_01230 [Methylotenera sp.]